MTIYEYTMLIAERAKQITEMQRYDTIFNAYLYSPSGQRLLDPIETAKNEIDAKQCQLFIIRKLPTGEVLKLNPNQMYLP